MTANVLRRQTVIGATVNMDSLEKTVKVSLHKLMYSLGLFIFNVLEFALILDTKLDHQVMYDFDSAKGAIKLLERGTLVFLSQLWFCPGSTKVKSPLSQNKQPFQLERGSIITCFSATTYCSLLQFTAISMSSHQGPNHQATSRIWCYHIYRKWSMILMGMRGKDYPEQKGVIEEVIYFVNAAFFYDCY